MTSRYMRENLKLYGIHIRIDERELGTFAAAENTAAFCAWSLQFIAHITFELGILSWLRPRGF